MRSQVVSILSSQQLICHNLSPSNRERLASTNFYKHSRGGARVLTLQRLNKIHRRKIAEVAQLLKSQDFFLIGNQA